MFGLLTNQRTEQLEQIAQLFLNETQQTQLNEAFIQTLPKIEGVPYRIHQISFEDLNGSLDEHFVPAETGDLCLKIPQSVPEDVKNLLIAKGVARWVLQLYQSHLNKPTTEDYLYGSDWTHTQNDEIRFLALCLLMPEKLFKEAVEQVALNHNTHHIRLDRLKEQFNVSEQAIVQRGISLGLFKYNRQVSCK